jgi:CheY-like chemotaxis protein
VVDRAARLIGAGIDVNSVPGRGSRFSITLSRLARTAPQLAQEAAPHAAQAPANGTILVVEGDAEVRAAMAALLTSWQYEVVAADSTAAALAALAQTGKVPRVVIADYNLGGGDCGIDIVQAVRARRGVPVPALLTSSDRGQHVRDAARKAGVVLLRKPLAPSKLRATLNYLLSQAASFEEAPAAPGCDLGRGHGIAADQRIVVT